MNAKRIVVAGANGSLGKLICEALVARAKMDGQSVVVIGLRRKGAGADAAALQVSSDPSITVETVDYDSEGDLMRVCNGAYCVISALLGMEDVVVGVQSRLLKAAIARNVRRFIPTDYSSDFFKLPKGSNRNFDLRLKFHEVADDIVKASGSSIEITSIFQGAFTDLFASGWVLLDYKKRAVTYFGSPATKMDFTTRENTAEFTAAAALDDNSTPRKLHISGVRLNANDAQKLALRVTGAEFKMKPVMGIKGLRRMISVMRFFNPAKNNPMPMWVGMQYGYCMALGTAISNHLDNDRYRGIAWDGVDDVVREAFLKAKSAV